jgi:Mrp family chromosome partitioning ATPase
MSKVVRGQFQGPPRGEGGTRTLYYQNDGTQAAASKNPAAARTQIGLPTVTVLPAPDGADADAARDVVVTAEVVEPYQQREEPAPRAHTSEEVPRSLMIAQSRFSGALERVLPAGGRKGRAYVPPAEVIAGRHVVPREHDGRLVMLDRKHPGQAAAIRALRHRIAERGDPRVILITSAGREEGRTFCAANLALVLAEVNRSRVLLLETDVRGRSLAAAFGLTDPPCFLDQLDRHKHDLSLPWRAVELSTYDLHLMPVSPQPRPGLLRALDGPTISACLDSLRGSYEYIVIDGPPVGDGPEVPLMEDAVDGLVFTSRTGRAHARSLRHALDQVSPEDVLGVTLLDF